MIKYDGKIYEQANVDSFGGFTLEEVEVLNQKERELFALQIGEAVLHKILEGPVTPDQYRSAANFLLLGFPWDSTEEGESFWSALHDIVFAYELKLEEDDDE